MIRLGRERFTVKELHNYVQGHGTLTDVQVRLIVKQWYNKVYKRQLNEPFDAQTKQIMVSMGFEQDHDDGWKLKKVGQASSSSGNRAIIAEGELAATKSELTTAKKENVRLQKELDAANAAKDTALAAVKYKSDQLDKLKDTPKKSKK
jgi:hypothetical protein